jgi:hypothetical protein
MDDSHASRLFFRINASMSGHRVQWFGDGFPHEQEKESDFAVMRVANHSRRGIPYG